MPDPRGKELAIAIVSNVVEILFLEFDTSRGKKLDRKEWPPCYERICEMFNIRYDSRNASRAFDEIDGMGNGRGQIDKNELYQALLVLYG